MRVMASRNNCRSSARSMASLFAPINSTLYFSKTPMRARFMAVFSAVWPPMVDRSASGRSFAITRVTNSGVMGSM